MTLDEKVGQTHQVANIDPGPDADDLRAGRIGSSLYASGATAGNERDAGVLAGSDRRHPGPGRAGADSASRCSSAGT